MTPAVTARARLELIAAGGFDDLLPTDPSAFRESERLTLAAPGVIAARVVFAARRRHFLPGSDPVLVDLPASETSAIAISATRIAAGAMRGMHEEITVEVHWVPECTTDDQSVDHWSIDFDHDGLVHRTMVGGDGPPPPLIHGRIPAHDAGRRIALRVVDRTGMVMMAETSLAARDW